MPEINPAALELGFRLGLGDISLHPPCHGFQNCCVCVLCDPGQVTEAWVEGRDEFGAVFTLRSPSRRRKAIKQPWELEAA